MATSRLANGGLSTSDLERIRDTLAGGRRPKVMFTEAAGQIAGQTGQVVELTDPEVSEEWLVVRFGHDKLPFSPADLMVPPRTRPNGKSSSAPAPATGKEDPMPTTATQPLADAAAAASRKPAKRSARPGDGPASNGPASNGPVSSGPVSSGPVSSGPASNGPVSSGKPAARQARPGRAGRGKTPPELTVTLCYSDGEWTVAAHQGSKVLAKPYLIRPAEALKLVGMIDVPGVQEAVEQVVAAERAEAERRAEQLRAQLAQVEAQLAELRQVG
jgi:hypothetical protein